MTKTEKAKMAVVTDRAHECGVMEPGEWVAVIGVNPIYFGRLQAWDEAHYHLAEASWIVDSGRLSDFLWDPQKAQEAEYVGAVTVERSAVQAVYRHLPPGKVGTR